MDIVNLNPVEWIPGQIQTSDAFFTEAKEKYLLNQVQLYGNSADNPLSEAVFKKFPYSKIYSPKLQESSIQYNHQIGQIKVMGDGQKQRYIINMFSQYHYDRPQFLNDSYDLRHRYFISCMNKIYKIKDLESIAIPESLCTGTARYITTERFFGRNWDRYLDVIQKFAKKYPKIKTVVYVGDYVEKVKERAIAKRTLARQISMELKKQNNMIEKAHKEGKEILTE